MDVGSINLIRNWSSESEPLGEIWEGAMELVNPYVPGLF
jgi:hypothetical protein